MIAQLRERGIRDERLLAVMRDLPRQLFVAEALASRAYTDSTLPIGEGQTLSQPYTVARMTEALQLKGEEALLEIGTGSGYQTAVLSRLSRWVFTVERLPALSDRARQLLARLRFDNVSYKVGDGSLGWPYDRRFERILVTAAAPDVPQSLLDQLAPGGVLILPQGASGEQNLLRVEKNLKGVVSRKILEKCQFVPLVGAQGWDKGG
ncbi:MAG: protein-L-isoaspartate(D-aspartate) O-methyltransferase [Magnetococcales bacterium]|nr:protein-L-isoaspartate(D-aspartate) O-methyltransferase [Magnetococcales bacterium]